MIKSKIHCYRPLECKRESLKISKLTSMAEKIKVEFPRKKFVDIVTKLEDHAFTSKME